MDPKEPVQIVDQNIDFICTIDGVNTNAHANARLISAAPEMLDALERLIPWACKALADGVHRGCAAPNDLDAAINYARAAIAKARGEA